MSKTETVPVETPTKLPPKYVKYAAARIQGKSKRDAGLQAGAKTPVAADKLANRLSKNVQVQQLIDEALEMHGATPEFAVGVIKRIAGQQDEIGAARLAAKDILELHGWRKGEQPGLTLNVKNAFFGESRNKQNTSVIEGDTVDDSDL